MNDAMMQKAAFARHVEGYLRQSLMLATHDLEEVYQTLQEEGVHPTIRSNFIHWVLSSTTQHCGLHPLAHRLSR